jgi:hypothetical protein
VEVAFTVSPATAVPVRAANKTKRAALTARVEGQNQFILFLPKS